MESVTDALDDDTACAILEPMVFDQPRDGFLQELKAACRRNGTLLVFDEMWTGFRFALGGAQERFGVQADLTCYSKAIANGMPLAVLAGRADVMRLCDKDVFFFTTFGGEALSLAAAKATIRELSDRRVPAYLARQGRVLRDGYNQLARDLGMPYTQAIGDECRSLVTFDPKAGDPLEMKSLVQQELLARGILWSGFHNMSFSHTDTDVAVALAAYREALIELKQAVDAGSVRRALLGSPIEAVFRRTSNFNMKPRNGK
jgi:glutamate-1-semialdehyde aminotransferase